MPPLDFDTPTLYAEQFTETHRTIGADHSVVEEELPGFIVVGVLLNGVKKELTRFKAGGFLADLQRHEAAQQQQAAEQQQQATPPAGYQQA